MRTLKLSVAWAGILLIAACAYLGVPKAESFNEKVAAAYTTTAGIANLTVAFYRDGKISREDALEVREELQAAVAAIDSVVTLYETDPQAAETRLQQIILGLQALEAALRASA